MGVLVVALGTGVQALATPPQVHLALSAAQAAVWPRPQTFCAARVAGLARPHGHVTIATEEVGGRRRQAERTGEMACV